MPDTTLAGRTEWEHRQYRKDHGHRAAVAAAHRAFAALIEADEECPVPPSGDITVAVVFSAAAVDRWAEKRHVTPEWRNSTYRAATDFGKELSYCVVYIPPDVLDERLDSAEALPELAVAI